MALERLFITCGGTGGHFYPGLAAAKELQNKGGKVLLLLSGVNAQKQSAIAEEQGIKAVALPWMPHPLKRPFKFISGLLGGYRQSRKLIKEFAPQAMLGMGSFASTPAILAAKFLKIPVCLHDGNARVGRANRVFSRFAEFLATAYECVNAKAVAAPLSVIGMPLRRELVEKRTLSKSDAINELNKCFNCNLDEKFDTILIFGGSQGAAAINENFATALKISEKSGFQVLHLCGKGKSDAPKAIYKDAKFPYLLLESSEKMELFLAAADIAVCRSGGSSLAELALFGIPSILIPYPDAAEGHQTDNAQVFERADAAVLVHNIELDIQKAESLMESWFNDKELWQKRKNNMAALARPQATEDLLALIEKSITV